MCTTFTEHVRTFGPDCELAACVLPRLERVLRRQMSRRQLLSAPPSYLGYPELGSWHVPGAFEDLIADCYVFAVARRLVGLRNQLRVRTDIDGLIAVNVRNFLFERQRANDMIGYATFGNVEGAVLRLTDSGEVTVEGPGEQRLDGASLIRLRGPKSGAKQGDPTELRKHLEAAPGWDEVLPELTATTETGQQWIADYLRRLGANGIGQVRVSEVVSVLSARVRADWDGRHAPASGDLGFEGREDEIAQLVRLVAPDSATENRDRWEMWKRVVPERIARLEDAPLRDRLAAEFGTIVRLVEAADTPSQADLIRELNLARSTVSRDMARLRQIVEEIQGEAGTSAPDRGY